MVLPVSINYQALAQAVRKTIIETYQHGTLLSLFPSEDIPGGIATEEWAQKYIKETKRASIHRQGYNPNKITMDFSGFKLKPVTADQECVLTEQDLAKFAANGMLPLIVPEIGKNMSYTTNTYIMNGTGGNGESNVNSQYNYIIEAGTSNGTAARPLPMYDTSGGAWDTHATMRSDIAAWIGGYMAKGGNVGGSIVLAAKACAPTLKAIRSEYNDHNIEYYIREQGVRDILYVDDEFLATIADGTTLCTKDLFDLIIIDPSEYVVGYTRRERVVAGPGTFPDRNYYVQGEVWFCFLPVPLRKNEAGTIKTYKHMGRCKDITTS